MSAKKRDLHLRVNGDRRHDVDTRRLARAIIRLTIEQDADQAQDLADTLEFEEVLRRKAVARRRQSERRREDAADEESA